MIIQGNAGQCTGHIGDKHVAGGACMGYGFNAESFEELLKTAAAEHVCLVVEQVLAESLRQSDAKVRIVGVGVHNDIRFGLNGIAGQTVVQRSGIVAERAEVVIFLVGGHVFCQPVHADAYPGVGVAVV